MTNPPEAGEQSGWKWVPVEPTEAMLHAAFEAWFGSDGPFFPTLKSDQWKYLSSAYRAMLSASPSPGGR